ncbi:hypothetical protein E2C01_071351 [Portunus trituberculatus]|uniref:Uncharacterized protein n=1 Tax=Portunus trituberculatus TaxID=210409 RepID=A0A5B7I492_PORTR|nr:hypothetical protein [Portunus trituberculatus]
MRTRGRRRRRRGRVLVKTIGRGRRGRLLRTGSNPVHGPSVGWASSLGATATIS